MTYRIGEKVNGKLIKGDAPIKEGKHIIINV